MWIIGIVASHSCALLTIRLLTIIERTSPLNEDHVTSIIDIGGYIGLSVGALFVIWASGRPRGKKGDSSEGGRKTGGRDILNSQVATCREMALVDRNPG